MECELGVGVPAVIIGELRSVLRLPKAGMREPSRWTLDDSDVIAHLIQVESQIQRSRWSKSKVSFTVQGDKLLDHCFPEFEDFVYAAVYLRQLVAEKDALFKDAVARYCRFVGCEIRAAWVKYELRAFERLLESDAFMVESCTVRELFDAFLYGAGLLHKFARSDDRKRKRFLEIYDHHDRCMLLYGLHTSLMLLMNHVGNATGAIYRDYSHWLTDYSLPRPDTRWHSKLFDVEVPAAARPKQPRRVSEAGADGR